MLLWQPENPLTLIGLSSHTHTHRHTQTHTGLTTPIRLSLTVKQREQTSFPWSYPPCDWSLVLEAHCRSYCRGNRHAQRHSPLRNKDTNITSHINKSKYPNARQATAQRQTVRGPGSTPKRNRMENQTIENDVLQPRFLGSFGAGLHLGTCLVSLQHWMKLGKCHWEWNVCKMHIFHYLHAHEYSWHQRNVT